jgi:hypothetical protein
LKGRPLLSNEANPVAGSVGDLCLADYTQYWLCIKRPTPGGSTLSVNIAPPSDSGHLGLVALPEGSTEVLMSDEAPSVFDEDSAAFLWRFRCDGQSLWSSTLTTTSGAKVGWGVVLQGR